MAQFKPQVSYHSRSQRKWVTFRYSTYRELRKNLPVHLKDLSTYNGDDDALHVTRSRRGEWGEWFETWKWIWKPGGPKPQLIKEGWM